MARKPTWPPPIHRHSSGQGRVRIAGRDIYLGAYGSDEAARRYAELIAAGRPEPPTRAARTFSVAEAADRYDDYASGHYRHPDGRQTSEMHYVRRAIGLLVEVAGDTPADEFRGRALKELRQHMISLGWVRTNVNHHVNVIKRIFRWLAGEELVSGETVQSLGAVEALKAGRTEAPESDPVEPVSLSVVEGTIPFLSPHLQAAVRLQLATACRPGEALSLRPCEIDTSREPWHWRPTSHKTKHAGRSRLILIGPRGQDAIAGLLRPGEAGDYHLFCPKESERLRRLLVRQKAGTPRKSSLAGRYSMAERYDGIAYHKAIRRACDKAGVPRWHPNQLRHTAATSLAAEFGVEVARIILGHSHIRTTEIYAEMDLEKATKAVLERG